MDPVCGMDLTGISDTEKVRHNGQDFFLCGKFCAQRFTKDPARFQGEPLIHLKDVWKVFGSGSAKTEVLRGINFHIWEGDFTVIIGASGSGKSTLLNMIATLDRPTSGRVMLRGRDISHMSDEERAGFRARTFGFVFQQYNLMPWLTAYDNVALPLMFSGRPADRSAVENRFREIGLGNRMTHRPVQLSGGEQQRVALLRALVNDPEIIIGDEPTGNLDSATGNKILDMLIDMNKRERKSLVIVTHDADIAERADQIITIKDGRIIRDHAMHKKLYTE